MIRSSPGTDNDSNNVRANNDDAPLVSESVEKEECECAPATSSSSETEKDCGSVTPEEKQVPEESGAFIASTNAVSNGITLNIPSDGRRASSYELRCVPVNVLFKPSPSEVASILSEDNLDGIKKDGAVGTTDLLHQLCLRPGYTLKTQMMLSFGTVNLVTTMFVVLVCIALAVIAGEQLQKDSRQTFEDLAKQTQGKTARYLAESLTPRLLPLDLVNFLHEATSDRFAGYPDPSDSEVPFMDMLTQTKKYPVIGPSMPLDWQLEPNVNLGNSYEHLQSRWAYYRTRPVNTVHAGFHFQGVCNPNITDPNAIGYYNGCTEAHNNITTGGVVSPASLTEMIHRKASDLVPLMRALYETREEVRDMGLYFTNEGAGASVTYPHYALPSNSTYISAGCDWMNLPHPYDSSRTLGTQAMREKCRPQGTPVDVRDYNPLEREWCIQQAIHPGELVASVGRDAWDGGHWLMFVGKGIFDRVTQDFIGCTYVGISLRLLDQQLKKAKVTERSDVYITTWGKQPVIVASSKRNYGEEENRELLAYEGGFGITKDAYMELFDLIDYEAPWDPAAVREKYEKFTKRIGGYFVTSYPIPAIPNEYDPSYKPYYLLFSSIAEEDVFSELEDVEEIVEEEVRLVTVWSIGAGVVGFLVSTAIIVLMANMLTSPLKSMNDVAQEIVYNFGDPTKEQLIQGSDDLVSKEACCTPKTELSDVVKEFNKLVKSFSGASMAKSEKGKHTEVDNLFTLTGAFSDIYNSRNTDDFKYAIERNQMGDIDFVHLGSNMHFCGTTATTHVASKPTKHRGRFSPLFIWTVALIVTPLIATSTVISAFVMFKVKNRFTEGLSSAKTFFLDFQVNALVIHANLRADMVSEITSRATNDLHVLTRYTEWLLFGALDRTDSFPTIVTGMEQCKTYQDIIECPFTIDQSFCGCDWGAVSIQQCPSTPPNYREFQHMYFSCESTGAAADGDRNSTEFPKNSFSPETTSWWDNPLSLPGWEKGFASGYDSTYDRVRVTSAMPFFHTMYNYDPLSGEKLASFVAFEADGTFMGYDNSCSWAAGHASLSQWVSTEENGAARARPELCPLGKHGYDPRCRGWYATGRNLALLDGTSLHITSPYLFAGVSEGYAQSATEPLIDPISGEYVGQTLQDFRADDVYTLLLNMTRLSTGGFPMLITSQGVNDTVVAPGFTINDNAKPIAELLLPFEFDCTAADCQSRLETFNEILVSMKGGYSDRVTFERENDDGDVEVVHICYSPVTVRDMKSVNSSDYSRGVLPSRYQVYVFGLGGTETGILEPFVSVEKATENKIRIAIAVVSVLLVIAAVFVVYISHKLTKSITEPMLYLLELIRSVNRYGADQDPPDLKKVKASKEIVTFSYTMEMLYKALRSANAAFYAGALEAAYSVLVDALRLFKRLDNKKAIGIASNNLGNTMLAMYREMELENLKEIAGLSKKKVLVKGIAYFHEAIQLGEKAYDEFYNEQGWTPVCLDFMQHLANRYFNRGLFLLSVKGSHETPRECERLGHRDLEIARDMDLEVIAYGEEIGWGTSDRPEKLFDVKLVRLRGYNILLRLGYEDVWETEELFEEAFTLIRTEAKRDSSTLFTAISLAGRLQELETELMKFKLYKGDVETAAKIAIRMLREDEKVFIDAEAQAVDILLKYLEVKEDAVADGATIKRELQDYREMLEDMVHDRKQAAIEDLESDAALSRSRNCVSDRTEERVSSNWALSSSSGRFVTMENF